LKEFDLSRFRVANPDALGAKEKELWEQLEPILHLALDDLKRAGKIETRYNPANMGLLDRTLHKLDEFSIVHNVFINLFKGPSDSEGYLAVNAKFGITEQSTISTYIMAALTVSMLSTELFKLLLLFITRKIDFSVANFSKTMAREIPVAWSKLERFVDSPFRNAIAHGTYVIVERKIRLFKNAKLERVEGEQDLELSDFMMRIKDQNVLFQVLVNVIFDKAKTGFFLPN